MTDDLASKYRPLIASVRSRGDFELADAVEDLLGFAQGLQTAVNGLMEIAEMAMPDSYFATDSRVVAAREILERL